jgi:hypothetical protein
MSCEKLCLVVADADLSSCEFLTVVATPFTASCWLAWDLAQAAASTE